MKSSRILKIFGVAFVLTLLVLSVPASPALAAATIDLSPSSGAIGRTVSIVGDGFTASTTTYDRYAEIYFAHDSASITVDEIGTDVNTYKLVAEEAIDTDGYFESSFTVPSSLTEGTDDETVEAGTYYVYVTLYSYNNDTDEETYSYIIKAKATFTVTSTAGTLDPISPSSGKAGTDILVSGSGFAASTAITFRFDSTIIAVKSGDSSTRTSGIFISTLTVPTTATPGSHSISVTISGTTVSTTFTVTASATLDPLSPATGKAGTDVAISGANFPASTALVFKIDSTTLTVKSGDSSTRSSGVFISTITIPATTTAGAHAISVTVGTSTVSATFTVTASAALNPLVPATGAAGTDVTATGTDFSASYPIIFRFDGVQLTPKSGDINTSTAGSFNSIITVPADAAAGAHEVSVTVGTTVLTATFTVTGTQPPPTTPSSNAVLSINTSGDSVGSQIGIGGAGFTPGATVTFKYDNVQVASATADASGLVTVIFIAPPSLHGEHTITVSDGTHTGTTTYTVESQPPPVPPLVLPEQGQKVKSPITFDWADVSDVSKPVSYDLQIAIDKSFDPATIVMDNTGLANSEFVYKETVGVQLEAQAQPYYWRVCAVDAAQNQSAWSDAREFYISPPFSFPRWALYLIIGIAALLLFVIGFWIGRRTAFYY
jgi:hypothetical protein